MKFSCRNFLLEDFLSNVNFQSIFQSSTEKLCSKCNYIHPQQLPLHHFLILSQPFKWHVFARDILIDMSVIQFNKTYLTIAKFENNPVSTSARTLKSQKWLYKKNPESMNRTLPLPRHTLTPSHFPQQISEPKNKGVKSTLGAKRKDRITNALSP